MNPRKLLHTTCIVLLVTLYLPAGKLSVQAQDGNRLSPTIQMVIDGDTSANRQRTSHSGILDPIGVFRNEQVGVNLILPGSSVNYPVGIAPLDGGQILASPNLTVNSERSAHFSFKGGETPGLYRVVVTIASEQYQLQFYVSSSSEPDIHCTPP
jgi:hypothetical protein